MLIKNAVLFIVLLLMPLLSFASEMSELRMAQFHLQENEIYQVPEGSVLLITSRLIMEKNAQIIVPSGSTKFAITAGQSDIAENTKISGNGAAGADYGENGSHGSEIIANFGSANIRGLTIESIGGDGHQGAPGGNGFSGSNAKCFGSGAGNGGRGGNGGNGGDGGNGGTIIVQVRESAAQVAIIAVTDGGKAGIGGVAGPGGNGGRGKSCKFYKRGGGRPGPSGLPGATGNPGSDGTYAYSTYD